MKMLFMLCLLTVLPMSCITNKAQAFPVGGAIIVGESPYQQCVDTCLAYNGYTTDTYSFCQQQCLLYPDGGVVIVVGGWYHGVYYPHGYRRGYEPRHDAPRYDRGHDHGRR